MTSFARTPVCYHLIVDNLVARNSKIVVSVPELASFFESPFLGLETTTPLQPPHSKPLPQNWVRFCE